MEKLEWDDFIAITEGVMALNQRDADEIARIRAAQGQK